MSGKLTRNRSTPKLAKWWDSVEASAANAVQFEGDKMVDPREMKLKVSLKTITAQTRRIRELEQRCARMAKLLEQVPPMRTFGGWVATKNSFYNRIDRELDRYRKARFPKP